MASDGEACCESDPNFAVICGFLEKFGVSCGLANIDFLDLQDMLENNQEVPQELIDLHVKLLRKARKSVSSERWERAIIKFCHGFCSQDAWEIERFGYKKARLSSKLRILKELLEIQFDYNTKFKNEVNKLSAEELRTQPLGRDRLGHIYWFQSDNSCQIRVYKEDLDEETWALVAKNREDLVNLITHLNDGKENLVNEDSNSLESEKPVVDTGQSDSSNSSKIDQAPITAHTEPTQLNGTNTSVKNEITPPIEDIKSDDIKSSVEVNDAVEKVENVEVKVEENLSKTENKHESEESSSNVEDYNKDEDSSKTEENSNQSTTDSNNATTSNNEENDLKDQPQDLKTKTENESSVSEPKKEIIRVKERYIRSDSISSSVSHSKAVDSAGFSVHARYLKGPPHEEDDMEEEPSCVKRPRIDRPTLLGNKKKKSYSDDEDEIENKEHLDTKENEENGSPIVGEVIEESVMHVTGEGSGTECETGNEQVQASVNQSDENSTSATNAVNQVQSAEAGNIKVLPWDAENSREQTEPGALCNSVDDEQLEDVSNSEKGEQASKKSMFFFGPGCLQVKPTISPKKKDELINDKTEEVPDTSDKPRNLVFNRRKSDKPVRKISGSDFEYKEVETRNDVVAKDISSITENNEVQSYNVNNVLPSPNHVPKNISISDTKDDSSKNFDNKLIDVPLIKKTDCSSTTKSDKGGLPISKNTSALLVDKPKSKLENVLEKINQGKIIKKTDGLDLDKHKNNNVTIMETKLLDNTPVVEKTDSLNNTECPKESSASSATPNSLESSNNNEVDVSEDKCNVKSSTEVCVSDKIQNTVDAPIPKEESANKEVTDIPKLEDNTKVDLLSQTDNLDLSPPSLDREVPDDDVNHSNSEQNENKLKTKSGRSRIENLESTGKTETAFDDGQVVGRRITRRTRSSTDKIVESSNDKDSSDVDDVKSKPKFRKKDDYPKIDKDLEALATNRELRERKTTVPIVNKEIKPKSKSVKNKKEVEDKKIMSNRERRSLNRNRDERKTEKLEEIEQQIVKLDSRPPKKLKLTESVQNSEEKKRKSPKAEEKDKNDDQELKPVEEPKCVKKKIALLTDEEAKQSDTQGNTSATEETGVTADEGNSSDIMIVPDSDPLAGSEEDSKQSEPPMTLATFKIDLDDNDATVPMRVTRKRAAQQSVDTLRESTNLQKKTESRKNKRPKLKRKRSSDQNLRRTVEEKKSKEISTSEEDIQEASIDEKVNSENQESSSSKSPDSSGESKPDANSTHTEIKEKKPRQTRKTLLGLEISKETENMLREDAPMGVRQSRRIAQLKIKEEAERRKIEEMTLHDLKEEKVRKGKKDVDADYKLEKKKKKKKHIGTDDETTGDGEYEEKKKRKKRKKHRDPRKQFDVHNPWKSSSGSSSSSEEEEEEEIEEDEDRPIVLKSDHEFSPESDLEEGAEIQPLKRARTAKKESDPEEEIDDYACQKCGQSDHPEWILLCDSCDSGWHCSCLRPALLVIPEGDWFCPPCQHATLVKKLEVQLIEYDKKINKKVMETRRKERLAYVGISLDNVLPSKESEEYKRSRHIKEVKDDNDDDEDVDSDESDSEDSSTDSESGTTTEDDSEPIYQLRKRRQAHSYRFNDYDDLINSAIQDEMDAVKGAGNQGRGKDISTIVNAEKQESESFVVANTAILETVPPSDLPTDLTVKSSPVENLEPVLEPLPPVVPLDYDKKPEESDEEIIRPVRKIISKKKHRKLNSLDVSSGDDAESDEDFKGSSTSYSDEEEDDYAGSESSEDLDMRKGKRYRDYAPIRRSTRARISRYDREFINDDSDTDGGTKRKKNRSIWEESESEESDRSWGRRKRRAAARSRKKPSDKPKRSKKKKKKRAGEESDPDVYKKRPNIKFGGLNDDEEIGRRTRGKKINYLEALGTDSDDDARRKPPRIEESDDEYAVHEDEDLQQRLANENDSDASGVENVLRDLPLPLNPKPRSKGRGKAGLKIPRKPKDQPNVDLFAPLLPDLSASSGVASTVLQQSLECQPMIGQQMMPTSLLLGSSVISEQDLDDEPNPIEQINKNVEQMNEQEMEKMMEEEDYANRQLQLVALQIEKEKKRKERERLEKLAQAAQVAHVSQIEQKIPKKRGRKPKNQTLTATTNVSTFSDTAALISNNAELSEPPGVSLPMFNEIAPNLGADGSPKKRRERESPLHGSKLGIAAPPQPFSQSQPAPSVITRMLQAQPGQGNFNPAAISKYFGSSPNDPHLASFHPGGTGPRGSLPPGPFQQPSPDIPHFPVIRSGPPPIRLHSPGTPALPPMYHAHRAMDPSPSGGGPINVPISNRDRQSPAVVSPSSNSPLNKGDPTPPPYTRPPPGHFPPTSSNNSTVTPRPLPMVAPPHLQHRGTNISPFHPSVPPNYHYGPYPPPPLNTDEGQPGPNYPAGYPEQYPDGGGPVPPPEVGANAKTFEEGDEGGEFVGLVSYFSSQREDDLDT
ncbi:hypothetical protein RN001_006826 [Aquatica leii]|uniref:Remodeling and spacing factor 1 n=1 Tax=Aquatica leii TaxID=1421715 RepID=A0AAN7Q6C6_9COLE|nr:hypothetical protein RN001_006826 [Aquatica leii]